MKLYLYEMGGGVQVLKEAPGEPKFRAQSNTQPEKFADGMANNEVINYTDSPEHAAQQANQARNDKLSQIAELEAKAMRSLIAYTLTPSNNTERGYLQGFKDQIDTIRSEL